MRFYTFNILVSLIYLIGLYPHFRVGVDCYLRHTKNSKSFIRKHKKGFVNYWFYQKLHHEINLGYVYYLNLALLSLSLIYALLSLSLGWLPVIQLPIAILSVFLSLLQVPSLIFCEIYYNLEYHKEAFVIYRSRTPSGHGEYSSIINLFGIVGVIAFAIYNIILVL